MPPLNVAQERRLVWSAELDAMLRRAGFARNALHPLAEAPQQVIVSVV